MTKEQQILKHQNLEAQAKSVMTALLTEVPFLQLKPPIVGPGDSGPDFEVPITWPGGNTTLLCEIKSSGQPAVARQALEQMESWLLDRRDTAGVFLAPYISEQVAEMCAERRVGTVDLSGNARLTFGNVYIHRSGKPNKFSAERELRSVFAPKSSRILRVLLEKPRESWQVQMLASEAGVSLGQVSAVKQALADREWLAPGQGVRLKDPEQVLRAWAEHESRRKRERLECYTSVLSEHMERRLSDLLKAARIEHALAAHSAAWRWAPMVKPPRSTMYIDDELSKWAAAAELKPVPSGGNVILIRPRDAGVFYAKEDRAGLPVVGAVQTILDCWNAGGRGHEAAEAVLDQKLRPRW